MERFRIWLWGFGIYLSVASFVTFSLFIHEEAIQTAMFGTWPSQDVGDWQTVKVGIKIISGINTSMKTITYSMGWIQPLALISYHQYGKATDYYIRGLTSKVLSNAPELFVGEEIELQFPVKSITRDKDGKSLANYKRIFVTVKNNVSPGDVVNLKGVLRNENGRLILGPP